MHNLILDSNSTQRYNFKIVQLEETVCKKALTFSHIKKKKKWAGGTIIGQKNCIENHSSFNDKFMVTIAKKCRLYFAICNLS